MKNSMRVFIFLAVFCSVGYYTNKLVTSHTEESAVPAQQIHLAGAMAGLFAGGAAAMFVSILLLAVRRD